MQAPSGFADILVAVAVPWALLLAVAWLCRRKRLGRAACVGAIACCYAVLGALALAWLGLNRSGAFGVMGMSLPFAVAVGLSIGGRRR